MNESDKQPYVVADPLQYNAKFEGKSYKNVITLEGYDKLYKKHLLKPYKNNINTIVALQTIAIILGLAALIAFIVIFSTTGIAGRPRRGMSPYFLIASSFFSSFSIVDFFRSKNKFNKVIKQNFVDLQLEPYTLQFASSVSKLDQKHYNSLPFSYDVKELLKDDNDSLLFKFEGPKGCDDKFVLVKNLGDEKFAFYEVTSGGVVPIEAKPISINQTVEKDSLEVNKEEGTSKIAKINDEPSESRLDDKAETKDHSAKYNRSTAAGYENAR